jgi:uncharacterized protein YuzE
LENQHIGSDFDDFLKEDGILEEVAATAVKRVIAWQLTEAMKRLHISKNDTQRISGQEVQEMKLNDYRDTDSLYIGLSSKTSTESREISEGIVLDYDAGGSLVGIDIDNASRKIDLKEVILSKISAEVEALTA